MLGKIMLVAVSLFTLVFFPSCSQDDTSAKYSFIRGYVVVPVITAGTESRRTESPKSIALPRARVFLFNRNISPKPLASALSDLSGRFALKTDKPGAYELCVNADGFDMACKKGPGLTESLTRISPKKLPQDKDRASVYGRVTMGDGSKPRGFAPFLNVNAYAQVVLETAQGSQYKGFVNNLSEYIIPSVPINEDFIIRTHIDKEKQEWHIGKGTNLLANQYNKINIQFTNRPPKAHVLSASMNGKPVQVVAPGSTVTLTATTSDLDDDKLTYRWALSDGTTVGPNADPTLDWTVPNRKGSHWAKVTVADDRGGYSHNTVRIQAGNNQVFFSGKVIDVRDAPIGEAEVDINGLQSTTNAQGRFRMGIPVADRYVMNIRRPSVQQPNTPSYGTASFVYSGAITGGRWILRPAQVFTVDPAQLIKLQHKRDRKRDCLGSVSNRINWQRYLNPKMFQWQDGRGYPRYIPGIGQDDPTAVQNVMKVLARMNPQLPEQLAILTKTRTDNRKNYDMPCRDGIQVEIPPNSLIDPSTGLKPAGDVQIALSAIDLSMSQMPGDFSAVDSNGKSLTMESFGAGSIEIGAGNARYNLEPGKLAKVSIPVDATQLAGGASLKSEIPFLYYNEVKGVWEQDGVLKLEGSGPGAVYTNKKVAHFSAMNADILKSDQSCVAVEVDPAANFPFPLNVEVTMQPSVVNLDVIQVRTLTIDGPEGEVIYNLPKNSNIVLTPIKEGQVQPGGGTGPVPAGVFVVNTGGEQQSDSNKPTPNPDGTYYSEVDGLPAGPCAVRVTLTDLGPAATGDQFLQGLDFEASDIDEFAGGANDNIAEAIKAGAVDYYDVVDPLNDRDTFNKFKSKNRFDQALDVAQDEVEYDAQFANSGDLGFGRDMHCRRNRADDGQFDFACYVTNYGQPIPGSEGQDLLPDDEDANHAFLKDILPDATVAMEYSRVENQAGVLPNNDRAVKFYVYNTNTPDVAPPITQADLDGFGNRPIPQLCMICHGGDLANVQELELNGNVVATKGAFIDRDDIMSMNSKFLPFDLRLYTFPDGNSKLNQQPGFKGLNVDIVKEVALGTGATAISELIDAFYAGNSAVQLEEAVIPGWEYNGPPADDEKFAESPRFYREVFAPTCRTCHVSGPLGAPDFRTKEDFHASITIVQNRVCEERIMPHAKRTNDIFWTSLAPNMPAFLQLYGETIAVSGAGSDWSPVATKQCGQHYEPGDNIPLSAFETEILPILSNRCASAGCHGSVGNSNFAISGDALGTYNLLKDATTKNSNPITNYIVADDLDNSWLYQRITNDNPVRMPVGGGPNLENNGEANIIRDWILAGAEGP